MEKKSPKKKKIVIEIDKDITDALGIKNEADIEMIIKDDMLIIKSKTEGSKKKASKQKDITNILIDKYDSVLKKLAKT